MALFFSAWMAAAGCLSQAYGQEKGAVNAAPPAKESSPEAAAAFNDVAGIQNGGDFKLAANDWGKFIAKYGTDPLLRKARLNRAICLLQIKNPADALAELKQVVDQPGFELREDALLNYGSCQLSLAQAGKAEMYEGAAAAFGTLAKEFPKGRYTDQALYFQGEALYAHGKKGEAIAAYAQLAENFPKSNQRAMGLYALGATQEEESLFPQAGLAYDLFLKEFEKHELATEVRMRKAESILQAGFAAVKANRADEAKKLLAQSEVMFGETVATKGFAQAGHALTRQALAASRQDKFADAALLYARAAAEFSKEKFAPDAGLDAGRNYYRAANYVEAAKWFDWVRQLKGEGMPEATHWLCRIHIRNKEYAKAVELVTGVLGGAEKSPFLVNLKFDQAEALYEMADKKGEAQKLFEGIAKEHADHELAPESLYNAAFAAQELKQYDQALVNTGAYLTKFSNHRLALDVRFVAAECQLVKGAAAEAEVAYAELLKLAGENPSLELWRLRHALSLFLQKKYKETAAALTAVLPAIKTPDRIAEAQFLIGASKFHQDLETEAIPSLKASLAANPKWRQADETMLLLARSLRKTNQIDEALATAQKLVADFPESKLADQATYRVGEYLYAKNQLKEARAQYDAVITKWPASLFAPYAMYYKGWCQVKEDAPAEAVKSFSALLEKHATHALAPDTRYARGMANRQAKNFKEAVADLTEYLKTNGTADAKSDAMYEKGLAEVALKDYASAVTTFNSILKENEKYAGADKVRYELSWAHKSNEKNDEALTTFASLVEKHPESVHAGEASFHLAEAAYEKKDFEGSIKSYTLARSKASGKVKELATYKLGYAFYNLKQYDKGQEQFAAQVKEFPEGSLAAEGHFMNGECLFKAAKHAEALASFQLGLKGKLATPTAETLALLHASQSAGLTKKWDESLKLAEQLATKFADSPLLPEAIFEQGMAKMNLNRLKDAATDFETVFTKSRGEVGAHARFMLGELRFSEKDYSSAVDEFKRLMYGFGGDTAPPEVKKWQALAGYEAGRCVEVQLQAVAADAAKKAELLAEARKYYGFVVEKHAAEAVAAESKKRLDVLSKF